jgi:hypothetical protein
MKYDNLLNAYKKMRYIWNKDYMTMDTMNTVNWEGFFNYNNKNGLALFMSDNPGANNPPVNPNANPNPVDDTQYWGDPNQPRANQGNGPINVFDPDH